MNLNTTSQSRRRCAGALFASLAAIALAACQTANTGSEVGHYEVAVSSTPMFRYGPAQSFGADFSLTEGTHVVMLKREFGYSRVMTDEGQTGYVATEDLKPAPPPDRARPSVDIAHLQRVARGSRAVSAANQQAVIERGPLFGGEDLPPLPERDPLQQGDAPPGFRVNVPQRKAGDTPPEPKPQAKPADGRPVPGFRVNVPDRDGAGKKP